MKIDVFDFNLPDKLIAQEPAHVRDECRLMFYDLSDRTESITTFKYIVSLLPEKCVLVFNASRVVPAKIQFNNMEILFLGGIDDNTFKVMIKPGRKFRIGKKFDLPGDVSANVVHVTRDGFRYIRIANDEFDVNKYLDMYGAPPLPPYIKTHNPRDFLARYQTVYATHGFSVAAPTAGLHFTRKLLDDIKSDGKKTEFLNLDVGVGTFAPIRENNIENTSLHSEQFNISSATIDRLNDYRKCGLSLISVGTTTLRALQSSYDHDRNEFVKGKNSTSLFIRPGFDKWVVDGLITNFHLPRSSLFILVCAFLGIDTAKRIYKKAIANNMRFYSFGDACLFLR